MLFKESMLNSLLRGIGQRLDKKPMIRMSWWRGKKWSSVFLIIPTLLRKTWDENGKTSYYGCYME
jgi:hypothetical protein